MIISPDNKMAVHQDHLVAVRIKSGTELELITSANAWTVTFTYKNDVDCVDAYEAILRSVSQRLDPLSP